MPRNRFASPAIVAAGILITAAFANAQILDGLRAQAESAVVHKGGQVIREAIDCALDEPQCESAQPGPAAPAAEDPTSEAPDPSPSVAPAPGQGFTATVTPWIERDTRGWDHLSASASFDGDAIVGRDRSYHTILLCDPERKWQGRLQFYVGELSEIEPGEYAIVKRWEPGPNVLASFYMPLASTLQGGTVMIETVGPEGITGSARVAYAASKYLHLESGAPPETHTVEASFGARAVPELTPEGAPACYW